MTRSRQNITRRFATGIALLSLLLTASARAQITPTDAQALERLRVSTEAHPDDPDLAWAYTRKLAVVGKVQPATDNARQFLARWPDHRPGARVEIARRLIEANAITAASTFLEEEIESHPTSGIARFYHGLALRAAKDIPTANREFAVAARLEPALRSDSLLAQAMGLFEMDREKEAVDLLIELLRTDPTSESAIRARLLLRERELPDLAERFRADAYIGFEFDDNVTLVSAENEVPASNREDIRGVWGLGGSYRAIARDDASLRVGYRFDQTEQDDLDSFSLLSNTLFVSGTLKASQRVALRLDAIAFNVLQDLENQLTGGSFRPSLLISFGPKWGVSRLVASFDVAEFDGNQIFEPLERDAVSYALGIEHALPLPIEKSIVSLSGTWQRTLTQAGPSGGPDGFDGDFDFDSGRIRAATRLSLPFDLRTHIALTYSHNRYHNDNFIHAATLGGGMRKRQDDVLNGRIHVSGPILPHVRWEMYWSGTRRNSNVELFDYDKQTVGALVRFSTTE